MTIIIIASILMTLVLVGYIILYLDNRKLAQDNENYRRDILDINSKLTNFRKDFDDLYNKVIELEKNPADFTKRFTMVDFKLQKMEEIMQTFNNGFTYQNWR